MKLKAKISLLAGVIALSGAMYLPQASATVTNLGEFDPGDSYGQSSGKLAKGSFDDWFKFTVSDTASLTSTGNSIKTSKGVELTGYNLYDGTTEIAVGTVSHADNNPLPGNTSFSSKLDFGPLLAGHQYSIEVVGTALNKGASYGFSFSTAPVPEPEEWAMMMVGIGLVGYQVRRKQNGLSRSTLA